MRCIEPGPLRRVGGSSWTALGAVLLLAGCAVPGGGSLPSPVPTPVPAAAATSGPAPASAAAPKPVAGALTAQPSAAAKPALPPPQAARNWDEFQLQAAQRLVQANPDRIYLSAVPDPLLAIPVLEVELTEDGHVRRIRVKRVPTQATDTVQLAKDAVLRAAPFGSMKHLDKPWSFVEVFLFDDERRFKPRTLDR